MTHPLVTPKPSTRSRTLCVAPPNNKKSHHASSVPRLFSTPAEFELCAGAADACKPLPKNPLKTYWAT
jgi:hypothetical protein